MTGTEIDIRSLPGNFARWDELLGLIMRSFAYMDGVIDPPSSALKLTLEALRLKAQDETCFLAWQGDRIAGCIFVAERDAHFYVGKLAVDPDLQGQGIGRALLDAAEALARQRGKPALELQTRVELTANHCAFRHLGFREAARTAHPGYERSTSVTMCKVLD